MIAKITTGTPASVQQIEEFVKNFIEVSEEKCAYLYVPRFWNLEIIIDEKKEEEIRFGCIKNTANKDIKWVFIFEYKFSFLEMFIDKKWIFFILYFILIFGTGFLFAFSFIK